MANVSFKKSKLALKRRRRVRGKVSGTAERPRLTVCKTLKHMYAQLIDDTTGKTLACAGTVGKEMASKLAAAKNKTDAAKVVGAALAEAAQEKGITSVVFDRNRCQYHGRVRAVADGAREGGLKF